MATIRSITSEAGPSLEEILSRHGLKETDLDRECPQSVRDEVAFKLDDWEMGGRYLEFTLEKLRDINRENSSQELCRIALLDTWGKREGKRATYLKLAGVLHRRQRCDLVELLCAKLKSTLTLVPLSGSVTSWEVPPANGQQHQVQQFQNGSSSTGAMVVRRDQTKRVLSATDNLIPNKDIQFGYHSASGKQIRITNNGIGAERMDPDRVFEDGVAYGAQPLKGRAEFEVKIVSYGTKWEGSPQFGVMRCKKGVPIESISIPRDSYDGVNHCVWFSCLLQNNLVTPSEKTDYGYVDLEDLREGDCVGLRLSQDGVLEFTVNGENQGVAIEKVYTRDSNMYAFVDHYGHCVATIITKAVTEYGDINLQELCLERLSSWLKSGDEVDRLPLPTRLKDKLKWYFDE